jgi:hypothetical protein
MGRDSNPGSSKYESQVPTTSLSIYDEPFMSDTEIYDRCALIMEAESTSETSVNFYQTTRHNSPEDRHHFDGILLTELKEEPELLNENHNLCQEHFGTCKNMPMHHVQ